jgi:hypothetical protein
MTKAITIFSTLLLLGACASSRQQSASTSTEASRQSIVPTAQQAEQLGFTAQEDNFTPGIPRPSLDGIGPVSMARSNFFFGGVLSVGQSGEPQLYDCMAGTTIPIATGRGLGDDLVKQYDALTKQANQPVYAKLQGYLINEPTDAYPKKLYVSYIGGLDAGTSACASTEALPGRWTALLADRQGSIELNITPTFDFTCTINLGKELTTVAGSWMMTSVSQIEFFYLADSDYLGHNVAFNPQQQTLFVTTARGVLTFKRT